MALARYKCVLHICITNDIERTFKIVHFTEAKTYIYNTIQYKWNEETKGQKESTLMNLTRAKI